MAVFEQSVDANSDSWIGRPIVLLQSLENQVTMPRLRIDKSCRPVMCRGTSISEVVHNETVSSKVSNLYRHPMEANLKGRRAVDH